MRESAQHTNNAQKTIALAGATTHGRYIHHDGSTAYKRSPAPPAPPELCSAGLCLTGGLFSSLPPLLCLCIGIPSSVPLFLRLAEPESAQLLIDGCQHVESVRIPPSQQ